MTDFFFAQSTFQRCYRLRQRVTDQAVRMPEGGPEAD